MTHQHSSCSGSHAPDPACSHAHERLPDHTRGQLDTAPVTAATTSTIRILQMDCPTEEGLIRNKLGTMAGQPRE